jgi:hypothetical protein
MFLDLDCMNEVPTVEVGVSSLLLFHYIHKRYGDQLLGMDTVYSFGCIC